MVRVTTLLCRVPVIKFRKGGGGGGHAPPAAATAFKPGSCPVGAASVENSQSKLKISEPKMLGKLTIPKGVLVTGQKGKQLVTLNIVLQRAGTDTSGKR